MGIFVPVKKLIAKSTIATLVLLSSSLFFISFSFGPGNGGERVTGAPFDMGTCSSCHGGGNYNATVSLQLLQGGTPVSAYVPGQSYTLRINRTASGAPAGFGFQLTSAYSGTDADINGWGTPLPIGVAVRTVTVYTSVPFYDRHYVEHMYPLAPAITQVDIPWNAPATSVGNSVAFYIALNTVNGAGSGGDEVHTASLIVPEQNLAIQWISFSGRLDNERLVQLQWVVSSDEDLNFFTVERGESVLDFQEIAKIPATGISHGRQTYQFTDEDFSKGGFYRISCTNKAGVRSYFKTIQVNTSKKTALVTFYQDASNIHVTNNTPFSEHAQVTVLGLDGRVKFHAEGNELSGQQTVSFQNPEIGGVYIIRVVDQERVLLHDKFTQY